MASPIPPGPFGDDEHAGRRFPGREPVVEVPRAEPRVIRTLPPLSAQGLRPHAPGGAPWSDLAACMTRRTSRG
jgi:hypothetical protein